MATPNTHDLGDLVRVKVTFINTLTNAAVDPSVVKVLLKPPSGPVQVKVYLTDSIVRTGVGAYYFDVNCNLAGTWYYRWLSTGTGQAAYEQTFEVLSAQAVP